MRASRERARAACAWVALTLLACALLAAGQAEGAPPFNPKMQIHTASRVADSPTALNVELNVPQNDPSGGGLATAHLRDAIVTLPAGVNISPAGGTGLEGCSDEQIGLRDASLDPPRFNNQVPTCPRGAEIGTVAVYSPLLETETGEPNTPNLRGKAYLGLPKSTDPMSNEMFRLFFVVANPERGLLVKLYGSAVSDPVTGVVTATFFNNPELPFSRLWVEMKGGPQAQLATPLRCGIFGSISRLIARTTKVVSLNAEVTIDERCDRGGFDPVLSAGSGSSRALASSPFTLTVARRDGDQEVGRMRGIKLPEGLLGRVADVELCRGIDAARGSCPAASRIGHVELAVGAGPEPLRVPQPGKAPTSVFLTGPYNGAPYGLSVVVPAQAGPFDLGWAVVRSALHVDERTAQLSSDVDETRLYDADGTLEKVIQGAIPSILKGIRLRMREVRVIVDRPGFMLNPTDCAEQRITADLTSVEGTVATPGSRFQVGACADLGFKPRFRAKILDRGRRSTLRSWHPRTVFTVVPRPGDANIGGARVALPSSTILDQANIGTTCTRAQMAARNCPAKSVVGYAKAWSPLLRRAVEGPVYLAANGGVRPLPDLAAVLDGEVRVVLQGEVSTLRSGGKARLQNTFRVVPDAPVSRFELTMRGGKNTGLLVNSEDLCRTRERGVAVFTGQNGRVQRMRPKIALTFKRCGTVRRRVARRQAARKRAERKQAAQKRAARKRAARM